jgi:glycerol kinase
MPGRVEHDASEIWRNVKSLIDEVWMDGIQALAITNQRETTVVWDRETGSPVCPAVVWQDVRGEALCRTLSAHAGDVLKKTGLMLSPYYPAAKLATVLRENPELYARAESGELCAGTVESYLIARLTNGSVFATDVSNAGRTQLLNLTTLRWDDELLKVFGIPKSMLAPVIQHSDAAFGEYNGVPITGVLGDSHAALFGHGCHAPGQVKATYGTGSSVMLNVGDKPVLSQNGLSASVGFGRRGSVCYVLEGNVTCSADTLMWLKDELRLFDDIGEAETIATAVPSTEGVQLVPAFSGLGAPYFDSTAARTIWAFVVPRLIPHSIARALLSKYGAPKPLNAGTS